MAWTTPADWDYKEAPGSTKFNEQIRDNLNYLKASIPPGVMVDYAGATAPDQWLLCNGAAVSRTTYAALFTAIGVTYGVGDGSSTFNLPDSRGRVTIGAGQGSGLTNRALGATGGVETINLDHTHTMAADGGTPTGGSSGTLKSVPHTHTIYNAGSAAQDVMNPFLAATKIIKY